VKEVAGENIYQAYIGSSANPGFRDFAIAAKMVAGRQVAHNVSFDVNPTSRQLLEELISEGLLTDLIHAGARLHQAGCNGCIGMGPAPATGRNSLRTVPRNFPNRSGTKEDRVFLCSPETAAASALNGVITDPRTLTFTYPQVPKPRQSVQNPEMLTPPPPYEEARKVELVMGPNIVRLPELDPLPENLSLPILLKVGDDISTDEIMPAGSRILPYRSNIPKISEFTFEVVDPDYPQKAKELLESGGHAVVGGKNYGQGSSREHAALAPRYLGLRIVIAKGFARIHKQNLINFGVLPVTFGDPSIYDQLDQGDVLEITEIRQRIASSGGEACEIPVKVKSKDLKFKAIANFTRREVEVVVSGGLTNWIREHHK